MFGLKRVTPSIDRSLITTILLLGLAGSALQGQALPAAVVTGGILSFDGRSTVGSFTGSTAAVTGEMPAASDLSGVQGWVEARVETLRTGNGRRDADLFKSMEAERYPTIRFELLKVTAGPREGDTAAVILHGRFLIHGVTRTVDLTGRVELGPDDLRLRTDTALDLKDYGIGGLSRMLGLLKMHQIIMVHVDLRFGQAPSEDVMANVQ